MFISILLRETDGNKKWGEGSLYTHTTSGSTTRKNTHFHPNPPKCGVQGQLRIDGTIIKTLLAQLHGQCTTRWKEKRTSQGAKPWASAASPVEGKWENFGSAGRWLAKIRVTVAGLSRSQTTGWRESRCQFNPCCLPFSPRSSGLRLRAGLVLLFILEGRGVKCLFYPSYI